MMRKLVLPWLVACIWAAPLPFYGQNLSRIQQYEQQIAQATTDTQRIKATLQLAFEVSDVDLPRAFTLTQEAEAQSRRLNFTTGIIRALWSYARIYDIRGRPDSSRMFYEQTLALAKEKGHSSDVTSAYINIGLSYVRESRLDEGMAYYDKAEENATRDNDRLNLADIYRKKANLVLQSMDYEKATGFFNRAIGIYEALDDSTGLGETTGSLGFAYRNWSKNDSAIIYFQKAIVLFEKLRYQTMIPVAYTEIGKAYDDMGQPEKALANYLKAEGLYKSVNYPSHQDALHCYIGTVLVKLGRAAEAGPHLQKALQLAQETNDLEIQSEALYGLNKYYSATGDYKKALAYYEQYDSLRNELGNKEQLAKVTEMTERYEGAKKEQQLQRQQFLLQRRNYWILGISLVSILAALLGFSYYRRYRMRQDARLQREIMRQQDIATRAVIEAEENERKRIAADLHDGLRQTMSAAKMNLSAWQHNTQFSTEEQRLAFDRIIALVDESASEIRDVSHNLMPNALLKAGLANAVREFIDKIDSRVLKIDMYSEGLSEKIDANIETVLYRVIQECVNNVIKHSGANHLDISLIRDDELISATIEDNGRGFDIANQVKHEGVGLKSIRSRVAYLKGEVDFVSAPGKGTLVAIHIPLLNQPK